jgi:SPP1 family predicted phage head-tail adaptor
MNNDAYLIKRSFTFDEIGNQIATETKNPIPIEVKSITRDEFYRAGEQKLNPEMMVTTAAINYQGEELIEIDSVIYAIYRKYFDSNSDDIELYLRKEVGNA